MKTILLAAFLAYSAPVWAQSSAFTYQGELEQSGIPATGEFDFEFALFDDSLGGTQTAGPFMVDNIFVDGGLFKAEVDFGPAAFGGADGWLEIRVRPGSSTDAFTVMTPRQKVTPAPLALHALNVESGAVGAAQADSTELQLRISDSCAPGEWIRSVDATGNVVCEADPGGDVTGITAQEGLTGGGAAGTLDLGVDFSLIRRKNEPVTAATSSGNAVQVIGDGFDPLIRVTSLGGAPLLTGGSDSFSPELSISDTGDVATTGTIAASAFSGDGSQLTAVDAELFDGQDSTDFASAGHTHSNISEVLAGAGLTGGGDAGSVSLSVATNGIDSGMIADGAVGRDDLAPDAIGIYGDASLGNVTLTGSGSFPQPFPMFLDLTIETGATLFVDSGTVIRCTGTFDNRGTVIVSTAAAAGRGTTGDSPSTHQPSHPGLSRLSAGIPRVTSGGGDNATGSSGGLGNPNWDRLMNPGLYAGGAGSGQPLAGAGGGSLIVLCKDGIVNSGEIRAEGESHPFIGGSTGGGGGGGGGFILLASASSIGNSGTVSAKGGDGGPSDSGHGAGGGGGGGLVHLIAPTVNNSGGVSIAGGSAGLAALTPVDDFVIIGGGGKGGDVGLNVAQPAGNGGNGLSRTTTKDPATVFIAY